MRLIFLSRLFVGCSICLFSCSNSNNSNELNLVLHEFPNTGLHFAHLKRPIIVYDVKKDTLFILKRRYFWAESELSYSLISDREQNEIDLLMNDILESDIKPMYSSVNHDIPFEYEIKAFKKGKLSVASTIYSKEYPSPVDSIYDYLKTLITLKKFKKIQLNDDVFSEVKIRSIICNSDTINLSKIDSYLIWKGLNISEKQIYNKGNKGMCDVVYDYIFNFQGEKIKSLSTDDGQLFYLEKGGYRYSFRLERKIDF